MYRHVYIDPKGIGHRHLIGASWECSFFFSLRVIKYSTWILEFANSDGF